MLRAVITHRYHGGWVAKNIYYMGFANVVRFGPLKIGGLSGIYNSNVYNLGQQAAKLTSKTCSGAQNQKRQTPPHS